MAERVAFYVAERVALFGPARQMKVEFFYGTMARICAAWLFGIVIALGRSSEVVHEYMFMIHKDWYGIQRKD
jgi:hypothetical protein